MHCPNCGTKVPPGAKFCASCGRAVYPAPPTEARSLKLNANDLVSRRSLRDWWHQILRNHGHYCCFAFFLCLPSDIEAIRYLADFGQELDVMSQENCLIIALSEAEYKHSNFDEGVWSRAVSEQISKGFSVTVAQLFQLPLTEFPCMVLFEDIRSPKRIIITLAGLTTEQISNETRAIFSLIQQSCTKRISPLDILEQHQDGKRFQKAGHTILTKFFGFAGKTFEAAMEAWIKAAIN
jgi:hypothetical protein